MSQPTEVQNEPKLTDTNAFAPIEAKSQLLNSLIWKLQREYYIQNNIQAWANMAVPCFVTSNSFIAKVFILHTHFHLHRNMLVLLCDLSQIGMRTLRPTLMSLYTFLRLALATESSAIWSSSDYWKWKIYGLRMSKFLLCILFPVYYLSSSYILSDFTAPTIRFWTTHPLLQKYVEEGLLDYAKFDCERDPVVFFFILTIFMNRFTWKSVESNFPLGMWRIPCLWFVTPCLVLSLKTVTLLKMANFPANSSLSIPLRTSLISIILMFFPA